MCLYGALGSPNEGDQACPRANGRGGSNLLSAVAAAALMLQISLQFESTSRGLQCCSQCTLCRSLSAAGAGAQRAEEQTLTLETRWTMPGTQPQVHNNKYLEKVRCKIVKSSKVLHVLSHVLQTRQLQSQPQITQILFVNYVRPSQNRTVSCVMSRVM